MQNEQTPAAGPITFERAKVPHPVDDPKALVPFGWAPGGYICAKCWDCGEPHRDSDKRSSVCQDCAEARRDRAALPSPASSSSVVQGDAGGVEHQQQARLAEIISDEEIARVHGRADFGPAMTPREVVNEGVRKYAVGYTSGYTQLTILLEHGLITKPRPGRYEASLTKKGKRYARALGMYHDTPAEPAEARVRELTEHVEYLRRSRDGHAAQAHAEFEKRVRATEALERIDDMRPATCETSLAHDMAQIASEALAALQQAGEVG